MDSSGGDRRAVAVNVELKKRFMRVVGGTGRASLGDLVAAPRCTSDGGRGEV